MTISTIELQKNFLYRNFDTERRTYHNGQRRYQIGVQKSCCSVNVKNPSKFTLALESNYFIINILCYVPDYQCRRQ